MEIFKLSDENNRGDSRRRCPEILWLTMGFVGRNGDAGAAGGGDAGRKDSSVVVGL